MAPKAPVLSYANAAHEKLTPYISSAKTTAVKTAVSAKDALLSTLAFFKDILEKYPPVKAFIYTLAGAAALPVAVFTGYGLVTGAILFTIAATIIGVTQGGFLAFGAFILFWFLVGALIVASIATFVFTGSYFALQVCTRAFGIDHCAGGQETGLILIIKYILYPMGEDLKLSFDETADWMRSQTALSLNQATQLQVFNACS